ncbi:lipoprotein [Acerihabitans sp. TG2]|uniref:lipoprotein n=1 Tax=Acerihabitans sp. TG2 TaxID=3096008 RepID=UPI002B22E60F|nr:lipoprotein [Acerihabitans sp. TG2]MEA9390618.1 lipoprotein [Acerihabitans sp. TG2]
MKTTLYTLLPLALLLSACTTPVEPALKDIGTRNGPCVEGGPDTVAQRFYDLRIDQHAQGKPDTAQLEQYRPYLSARLFNDLANDRAARNKLAKLPNWDIFSGQATAPTDARVHSASRILNTDARNIPLRVDLTRDQGKGGQSMQWQDEVLMIREGRCWVLDDVRYLGNPPTAPTGTLSQALEPR